MITVVTPYETINFPDLPKMDKRTAELARRISDRISESINDELSRVLCGGFGSAPRVKAWCCRCQTTVCMCGAMS